MTTLAERHGTQFSTVRATLRRNGVKLRGPGGRRPHPLTEDDLATIVAMREAGQSITAIARVFGVHYGRITWELRRLGLYQGRGAKFGEKHPLWRGGRIITGHGYVMIKADPDDPLAASARQGGSGYVMEHRVVMARKLGRPLLPTETVHHINADKQDNRPENLELRVGRHGKGATGPHCASCTCFA